MSYFAFFDLDETLISCKSLFEVFKYYCRNCGITKFYDRYDKAFEDMQSMVVKNIDRAEINRLFYGYFAGIRAEHLQQLTKTWFFNKLKKPDFFHVNVLNALKKHQEKGAEIVLVSGSFSECVVIIADYLAIKNFLCIHLQTQEGVFSGNIIGEQTVGDGKQRAILDYVKKKQLGFVNSYAYADHISDLSMLRLVKNPVIVGHDKDLLNMAIVNGWSRISI